MNDDSELNRLNQSSKLKRMFIYDKCKQSQVSRMFKIEKMFIYDKPELIRLK
jgi:hypothetical protein